MTSESKTTVAEGIFMGMGNPLLDISADGPFVDPFLFARRVCYRRTDSKRGRVRAQCPMSSWPSTRSRPTRPAWPMRSTCPCASCLLTRLSLLNIALRSYEDMVKSFKVQYIAGGALLSVVLLTEHDVLIVAVRSLQVPRRTRSASRSGCFRAPARPRTSARSARTRSASSCARAPPATALRSFTSRMRSCPLAPAPCWSTTRTG
jgi:hypothetical protein